MSGADDPNLFSNLARMSLRLRSGEVSSNNVQYSLAAPSNEKQK
jgi:hypothetical protein